MITKLTLKKVLVSASVLMTAFAGAMYTEAKAQAIDEIVVTSQKRAAGISVQDIATSVTAVNAELIEATDSIDLTDIGRLAPNATLHPSATFASTPNFLIRGIGVSGTTRSLDPSVGVVVDGERARAVVRVECEVRLVKTGCDQRRTQASCNVLGPVANANGVGCNSIPQSQRDFVACNQAAVCSTRAQVNIACGQRNATTERAVGRQKLKVTNDKLGCRARSLRQAESVCARDSRDCRLVWSDVCGRVACGGGQVGGRVGACAQVRTALGRQVGQRRIKADAASADRAIGAAVQRRQNAEATVAVFAAIKNVQTVELRRVDDAGDLFYQRLHFGVQFIPVHVVFVRRNDLGFDFVQKLADFFCRACCNCDSRLAQSERF